MKKRIGTRREKEPAKLKCEGQREEGMTRGQTQQAKAGFLLTARTTWFGRRP